MAKGKCLYLALRLDGRVVSTPSFGSQGHITKTCLYNFDPLKPHFYIKLGFSWIYIIFLIFAQKHKLWVLVRNASPRRF